MENRKKWKPGWRFWGCMALLLAVAAFAPPGPNRPQKVAATEPAELSCHPGLAKLHAAKRVKKRLPGTKSFETYDVSAFPLKGEDCLYRVHMQFGFQDGNGVFFQRHATVDVVSTRKQTRLVDLVIQP